MRAKFLSSSLIALITFIAFASKANALEWAPAKLILTVEGERHLAESNLGLHSCLFIFQAPSAGLNVVAGYFGPSYTKKSANLNLWISPQVVGVANYFPGRDALGPSLWIVFNTARTSTFVAAEAYFGSNGRRSYYGLYTFDLKPVPWLQTGVRSDQVDKNFIIGPQARVNQGVFTYGLAYLIGPQTKTQEFRFVFGLAFQ